MRSIWNGALSFGLINIPVRVYPAAEEHALDFDMLHKKDLSPIRYARICKLDGKEVPYKDIIKGFEYEKGEYVIVDEKDFKAANAKKTSVIDIQHFTPLDAVDPIYFEKPYYLEPEKKGGGKAYQLLREALKKSKKSAIANYVFRNREHIGIITPSEEVLLLLQLRYAFDIRSYEELTLPKDKIAPKEIDMALMLIDKLTQPFEPKKYHDTYTEELMGVIEQKLQGKKPSIKAPKVRPVHEARDLMGLLQESLSKSLGEPKKRSSHRRAHR